MEIVTQIRQQQSRVSCLNLVCLCKAAKIWLRRMALTRGAVTKQTGLLHTNFWFITLIRICQKCFSVNFSVSISVLIGCQIMNRGFWLTNWRFCTYYLKLQWVKLLVHCVVVDVWFFKSSQLGHVVQVQRSAVRVCGDWSEHISSSGKRYYYNCKTEVSQWEKPKEWSDRWVYK